MLQAFSLCHMVCMIQMYLDLSKACLHYMDWSHLHLLKVEFFWRLRLYLAEQESGSVKEFLKYLFFHLDYLLSAKVLAFAWSLLGLFLHILCRVLCMLYSCFLRMLVKLYHFRLELLQIWGLCLFVLKFRLLFLGFPSRFLLSFFHLLFP